MKHDNLLWVAMVIVFVRSNSRAVSGGIKFDVNRNHTENKYISRHFMHS